MNLRAPLLVVLTLAGSAASAHAATPGWTAARWLDTRIEESTPPSIMVESPARPPAARRRKTAPVKVPAEARKPRGPLVIAIALETQTLRLYDADGFFAESPVSTGTRTHPTPMGVYSIIQKNKHHRSNLYSDAPMPFMQRLTWSGIALHAGVLPGYPASHGCIRMPMSFATRL